MKNLLIVVVATLATSANVLARDNDVIRLGIDPTYPPMESKAPDGSVKGFEADLGFLQTPAGKGFSFVGEPLSMGDRGAGIGLRKDETTLQATINTAIASMLKDGTYAQIARKYFDFNPYGD